MVPGGVSVRRLTGDGIRHGGDHTKSRSCHWPHVRLPCRCPHGQYAPLYAPPSASKRPREGGTSREKNYLTCSAGLPSYFLAGPQQQVGNAELFRPLLQIADVESPCLYLQDSDHVSPLILRNLAALPVPVQL